MRDIILTNIRLLQIIDKEEECELFAKSVNNRVWEKVLYHLVLICDPTTVSLFENCYPVLIRTQSKDFRLAVFKYLDTIKANELKAIMIRKSDLDDFRGERFERIVLLVSTVALQKRFVLEQIPDHHADSIQSLQVLRTE
jgi:hypothetical protein